MNKLTTQLVGATIGAAVGYLIADWYIDTHMSFEEDFELEDPIEKFNRQLEKMEEVTHDADLPKKSIVHKHTRNYTEYFKSNGREDLAELVAKYNGDTTLTGDYTEPEPEGVLDATDVVEDPDMPDFDENKDPCIISVMDFANDMEYAHLTLSFYDDDVVTDEEDNPINRPEKILGDEALVSFGVLSEDEDIVYVRNKAKKAMYEVVRTNKNYASPVAPRRVRRNSKEETVDVEDKQDA